MGKVVFALAIALLMSVLTVSFALAAPPDKTSAYVEPMVGGQAGEHGKSDNFQTIGDHIFVVPPSEHDIMVPSDATNMDGLGSPSGPHSQQGEEDYSPIWAEVEEVVDPI
jgi:hypothetical protein